MSGWKASSNSVDLFAVGVCSALDDKSGDDTVPRRVGVEAVVG